MTNWYLLSCDRGPSCILVYLFFSRKLYCMHSEADWSQFLQPHLATYSMTSCSLLLIFGSHEHSLRTSNWPLGLCNMFAEVTFYSVYCCTLGFILKEMVFVLLSLHPLPQRFWSHKSYIITFPEKGEPTGVSHQRFSRNGMFVPLPLSNSFYP